MLRLGVLSQKQGNYEGALHYYNRLDGQLLLTDSVLNNVNRYKQQAISSTPLETQEDLFNRATSGSGASNRWNAALEGLEYYPTDNRFVSALQAASHNILRQGLEAHENGNYAAALLYYDRLESEERLEATLLKEVSRYKQQAASSIPLETKEDLYIRATRTGGASARWYASLEGIEYYPDDIRFVVALEDSSSRILRLGVNAHQSGNFTDALVYYQRIINENRTPNSFHSLAVKLNDLANQGDRLMTPRNYVEAIQTSSYASASWHLAVEAMFLYPNDSTIQNVLNDVANRQLILGKNYYQSGDMSSSRIYFERVLSEPLVSQSLRTLAASYSRLTQVNYKPTIYIDAGHGGYDSGAAFGGVREKVLNLNTSRYLKDELEKRGYNVLMSRTTDKHIDLTARPLEANEIDADLFISIHYNSMGGLGTARGIETFIYHQVASGYGQEMNRNNFNTHESRINESLRLADNIQKNLIRDTNMNNRSVKGQNFNVLRNSQIPAILTELGFLDNPTERAYVNTKSFQQTAARSIAKGVDQYFSR